MAVRVLQRRWVYRGPVFNVRQDRVVEPGGVRAVRDVVVHSGSVVLLPVLNDGRILLVRQYRHAVERSLWELVAGRIDPRERPLAAARRELAEETGYRARSFRRLLEYFPTPGFLTERMVVYLVRGLRPGAARPEEDERLIVRSCSLRRLERMIRAGRIRDGKTILSLLFYLRFAARRRAL
jgi:ADP-ribose pyrophosphatase